MKIMVDRKKIEEILAQNTDSNLVIEGIECDCGSYYHVSLMTDGGFTGPNIYLIHYDTPTGNLIHNNLTEQGFAYQTEKQALECAYFMMKTARDYKEGKLK